MDLDPPAEARLAREALATVREAGLRHADDRRPGFSRQRFGAGWVFRDADGRRIREADTLERLRRLAVPPAWTDVWICPRADGHIQATGRDARGRKQYRYHADWRATRDAGKYGRLVAFGRALPRIRRRVAADLRRRGLGREKVLAVMVRLLETTLIRVGNEEYARQNRSYGLSTLRNRHARVRGAEVRFRFRGKSGRVHEIGLHDERLARLVRRLRELPGQDLFQYLDDSGAVHDIGSADVNDYLREAGGEAFSAKDFRTWAGTVLAALFLARASAEELRPLKKTMVRAVEAVAAGLGNTPAVCRRSYIHPAVFDAYLAGRVARVPAQPSLSASVASKADEAPSRLPRAATRLSAEESAVLAFLRRETAVKRPRRAR
jgi:DNA topoisomerase-1